MVNKTVEIDNVPFYVYATVDEADAYMRGSFNNQTWFSSLTDPETKARALITATRILDKQCWLGSPAGLSGQVLAWPRTGVSGVSENDVPDQIVYGCIELANLILDGSDVADTMRPGAQTIQSLKAGSVAITYFRDAEGLYTQNARFPIVVQELVGKLMCGSVGIGGAYVTGGHDPCDESTESVTKQKYGFSEGL